MNNQEWNYMQCNQCYVMWPHLTVPEVCVCGNDMNCNSTRKKFFLTFRINEIIDNFCFGDTEETIEVQRSLKEEFAKGEVSE